MNKLSKNELKRIIRGMDRLRDGGRSEIVSKQFILEFIEVVLGHKLAEKYLSDIFFSDYQSFFFNGKYYRVEELTNNNYKIFRIY